MTTKTLNRKKMWKEIKRVGEDGKSDGVIFPTETER